MAKFCKKRQLDVKIAPKMSTALKKCGKVLFFVDMWNGTWFFSSKKRKKMIILGLFFYINYLENYFYYYLVQVLVVRMILFEKI